MTESQSSAEHNLRGSDDYPAPIRLLASDLDGTIFGDDLVISPRTRRAIQDSQARGVVVTIATGRMFRSAQQIASNLEVVGPIICYQGAMVRDADTSKQLLHETIPHDLAHSIFDETERLGLHLNVYFNDELYVSQVNRHAEFYSRINMSLPMTEVGSLHAWLEGQEGKEPTKLVIVTDAEETDTVLRHFMARYGASLQVTKSHARFTEFTNKLCSKGRALALLAAELGIPRESVMAIGDGLNDLDMIAWAGLGVAMDTCPQEVRAAARVICPPLSEDGAAVAIERYVLGRER
jgi:Cof subfamily protein (haloacid dehalogenase superfamily)